MIDLENDIYLNLSLSIPNSNMNRLSTCISYTKMSAPQNEFKKVT